VLIVISASAAALLVAISVTFVGLLPVAVLPVELFMCNEQSVLLVVMQGAEAPGQSYLSYREIHIPSRVLQASIRRSSRRKLVRLVDLHVCASAAIRSSLHARAK
jgi:hypothetical protein